MENRVITLQIHFTGKSLPLLVGIVFLVAGLPIGGAVLAQTHEEPWLQSQFGDAWRACRGAVPCWLPRLRPWRGS